MDLRRIRKKSPRAAADPGGSPQGWPGARRLVLKVVYWLAVLIVSLVIVFLLVLLFESLDDSSVDQGTGTDGQPAGLLGL